MYTATKKFADDQLGIVVSNIRENTEVLIQREKNLEENVKDKKNHNIVNINAGGSITTSRKIYRGYQICFLQQFKQQEISSNEEKVRGMKRNNS